MSHVIVTGPESTGKTTLVNQLADHYRGVAIPEYPRGYLEAVGRYADTADFEHFVRADARLVAAAKQQQTRRSPVGGLVIQDTGLEVLHIWHEDKFGPTPAYLTEALHRRRADLYLLCRPDLPWEYDPLREDPHRRRQLFGALRNALDEIGVRVVEIDGFDASRLGAATAAIDGLNIITR